MMMMRTMTTMVKYHYIMYVVGFVSRFFFKQTQTNVIFVHKRKIPGLAFPCLPVSFFLFWHYSNNLSLASLADQSNTVNGSVRPLANSSSNLKYEPYELICIYFFLKRQLYLEILYRSNLFMHNVIKREYFNSLFICAYLSNVLHLAQLSTRTQAIRTGEPAGALTCLALWGARYTVVV